MKQILLENIVGDIANTVENILKTGFISKNNLPYHIGALHIFAENIPTRVHNETILDNLSSPLISLRDNDEIPEDCLNPDIVEAKNCGQWETGGLVLLLRLKIDARVMIAANIDIPNR